MPFGPTARAFLREILDRPAGAQSAQQQVARLAEIAHGP